MPNFREFNSGFRVYVLFSAIERSERKLSGRVCKQNRASTLLKANVTSEASVRGSGRQIDSILNFDTNCRLGSGSEMQNAGKVSGTSTVRPLPPFKCLKRKAQTEPETEPERRQWKELPPQCSMCSNAASLCCARCNCSFYCSMECRNADWQTHKVICSQWLHFEASGHARTPPNPSSRRGIFFPAGTDTPQFVWVTTEWVPAKDANTQGCEKVDFKPFVGADAVRCIPITGNAIRSRRRVHECLQLYLRPTATTDGSSRNRTASRVVCGQTIFYPWCGSMLAMKSRLTSKFDRMSVYAHMDCRDFRDLVDLFCSYHSGIDMNNRGLNVNHKGPDAPLARQLQAIGASEGDEPPESPADELYEQMNSHRSNVVTIPGVRINCLRDMHARGKDMYEFVAVPTDDPIWGADVHPTIVSQLVDYPIRTRRIRPVSDDDEENLPATFLHMYPYLLRTDWEQAFPRQWQGRAGSVLVVHADYPADVTGPYYVKELCSFCIDFLKPCLEIYLEGPEDLQLREDIVRTVITPQVYHTFCDVYEAGVFRGATDWPVGGHSAAEPPTMFPTTAAFRRHFSNGRRAIREQDQEQDQDEQELL